MKFLLSLQILCFAFFGMSQDVLTINIVNTMGQPVTNTEVTGTNGSVVLKQKTNVSGSATFEITEVGVYTFSFLNQKEACTYEKKEGFTGRSRRTITYDPDGVFAIQPTADRSKVSFTTVNGFHHLNAKTSDAIKVIVNTKERSGKASVSVPVTVVSISEGLKFEGTTDGSGYATFYLKTNMQYDIDVDGIESYQTFKLPKLGPGAEYREVVYFERPRINEIVKGDTLIQNSITQTTGSSTHILFTLNLRDYNGFALADEPVYARADEGSRVYEGKTNAEGKCTFMLKKGVDYFINFKYEQDVAYIECKGMKGFAQYSISRRYRGSAAIERMLEERHANGKGFVVNHEQTPIDIAPKPSDYLTRTATGFVLDFKGHGPGSTPTIVGDRLYAAQCYYSPEFYCVDANTGAYQWGVILGESGISPAVHHNGVLLINTESCTLYALDAATGKLLWSKWLAGYLYTTPSADGDRVYVVYDNGGENPNNPKNSHVIACFDLRTGEEKWMNWLDDEAIACPVIYENEVHISSKSGKYYLFDKTSGDLKMESSGIRAITTPTVTPNGIFLTVQNKDKEQLVVLDRKTLKVTRTYASDLNPTLNGGSAGLFESANFNGSHPVVYKNEKVLVLDHEYLRVFDAKNERLLWEKKVNAHDNQVPVVINNQAIVATNSGEVKSFDLETGAVKTLSTQSTAIEGQPVSHGNKLILSAAGIITVVKSIINPNWTQWNKNEQHNLLIE